MRYHNHKEDYIKNFAIKKDDKYLFPVNISPDKIIILINRHLLYVRTLVWFSLMTLFTGELHSLCYFVNTNVLQFHAKGGGGFGSVHYTI